MSSSGRLFFFPVYADFDSASCLSHVIESIDFDNFAGNEQQETYKFSQGKTSLQEDGKPTSVNVSYKDLTKRQKNLVFYEHIDSVCKKAILHNQLIMDCNILNNPVFHNDALKEARSFLYMETDVIYYGDMFNCRVTPNGNLVVLIREGFLNFLSGNKDQITKLVLECSRLMYYSEVKISDVDLHSLIGVCLKYNQHPERLRVAALEIASFSVQGVNQ